MARGIAVGEIKTPVVTHDIIDQPVPFGIFHLDVGCYTPAVANLTPRTRMPDRGEAVGNPGYRTVGIAVAIVYRLYQTPRRDVIFRYGELKQTVIRELAC